MTTRTWQALLLAAVGVAAAPSHAHHSLSAIYDSSRQLTVEGNVAEFQFVNPHPILVIEVTAADGASQRWQLEMDNRFELANIGFSSSSFRSGDRVIASGSVHRSDSQRLYLRRLDRPADEFRYEQIGSRPRVNRAP